MLVIALVGMAMTINMIVIMSLPMIGIMSLPMIMISSVARVVVRMLGGHGRTSPTVRL
jgi:hypothetical protein